mmetsp:Transcript_2740/g.8211  ORF Transcript_2740/g.8211 Transcript_2740/m.8211 type:complete len:206 (-) Transcript_2740:58-675(-)
MSSASSADRRQSSILPPASSAEAAACRAFASPRLSPTSRAISLALLASVMASESFFAAREDWISASISNFLSPSCVKIPVASVAACAASSVPLLVLPVSATESSILASPFLWPADRKAASSSLASAAASAALPCARRARTTSRAASAAQSLSEASLKVLSAFLPAASAASQASCLSFPSASTKSLLPASPFLAYSAVRSSAMGPG